jgi:hypothetical protein
MPDRDDHPEAAEQLARGSDGCDLSAARLGYTCRDMKRRCYFHAGCPDGFGAAWAIWRVWGEDGRYVPRGHEDPLDARSHEGDEVVFADIAPKNEQLRALGEVAEQLVVLDHHLSARDHFAADTDIENLLERGGHYIHFDLEHSGAVLAWQHFHPNEPVPDLLRYVEDQDLWTWKLPDSAEVNAAIGSYAREFPVWSELAARPWQQLAAEGEPILRSQRIEIERTLHAAHPVAIGTWRVEAVNAPHQRSAIGHELAKRAAFGRPVGLVYRVTGRQVDVSIYSIGDVDVSAVAREFGGGGHLNAAGFSVSLRSWLANFV